MDIKTNQGNSEVEVICIGTELLLGNILNSNARWLAEELAALGLPHFRQLVIGDNPIRLKDALLESAKRARFLITTGGLGPTPDDLTKESIAEAFNSPLEEREEILKDIQNKLKISSKISSSNTKQALFPPGAEIIPNRTGTAPGMIWSPNPEFTILTFPGVPSELKDMWRQTGAPWLRNNSEKTQIFISRVMHFAGIPESTLAESIEDLLDSNNPTIAPYAGLGQVKLRLTAKGESLDKANALLKPLEKKLCDRMGLKFFGLDNDSLASVVLDLLRKRGEKLVVAESCTAGGVGAALAAIPGASDVFIGGIIAYSNETKQKMLEVPLACLEEHGAVSDDVVQKMALGAQEKLGADWAIAISGVAGPSGGTISKPVGLVHIAVAGPQGCKAVSENFGSHRERIEIQQLSVVRSLDRLRLDLLERS